MEDAPWTVFISPTFDDDIESNSSGSDEHYKESGVYPQRVETQPDRVRIHF